MTICYFGADMPWEKLQGYGFRRRNTCLLKGFVEHPDVEKVLVITSVLRPRFFQIARERFFRKRNPQTKVQDVYVTSLLPERRWLPGVAAVNRFLARLQLRWQAGLIRQPVTWCYWPDGYRLAKRLDLRGPWVFDADHNILQDENRSAGEPGELEALLRECARKVQLVVANSRSMLAWFSQNGARQCSFLREGVDPTRFNIPNEPLKELRHLTGPKIGYVGMLSCWVDYELLAQLAAKRADWTFIVVGPLYRVSSLNNIEALPNVIFTGEKNASEVPAYVAGFGVALSLYKKQPGLDLDSMKIFEYLAAGVPVVSKGFHPDLENDFPGLLELADDVYGFEQAIERVLNWPAETRQAWDVRRRQFVEASTWTKRSQQAVRLLQNL